MGFYVCVCLFVLGIRDDFIWLTVAKTSNTFNLGWASMPWEMLDTRLLSLVRRLRENPAIFIT